MRCDICTASTAHIALALLTCTYLQLFNRGIADGKEKLAEKKPKSLEN